MEFAIFVISRNKKRMSAIFKKMITLSLAFIVLISGMGLAVSKHYCSNELRDMKFFKHADSCMIFSQQSCDAEGTVITKESCCKNVHNHFIDSSDKLNLTVAIDLNWHFNFDYFALFKSYIIEYQPKKSENFSYCYYLKPYKLPDISIWNQTFLI